MKAILEHHTSFLVYLTSFLDIDLGIQPTSSASWLSYMGLFVSFKASAIKALLPLKGQINFVNLRCNHPIPRKSFIDWHYFDFLNDQLHYNLFTVIKKLLSNHQSLISAKSDLPNLDWNSSFKRRHGPHHQKDAFHRAHQLYEIFDDWAAILNCQTFDRKWSGFMLSVTPYS